MRSEGDCAFLCFSIGSTTLCASSCAWFEGWERKGRDVTVEQRVSDSGGGLPEWMETTGRRPAVRECEPTIIAHCVCRAAEYVYQIVSPVTREVSTAWCVVGRDVYLATFPWGAAEYRFEFDLGGSWRLERSWDTDDTKARAYHEVAYGELAATVRHISYASIAASDGEVQDIVTFLLGELLQRVNVY